MVSRPVMFIHGGRDTYIHPSQAHLLHGVAEQPKYLWIVPGARHNKAAAQAPNEYAARTVAFFRKYLAGEAVSEKELIGGGRSRP